MPFLKKSFTALAWVAITKLLAMFPLRFISLPFSLGTALAPLMGISKSPASVAVAYLFNTGISSVVSPVTGSLLFCTHLPTASGSFFLATSSRFLKATLIGACIVLFISHPIGGVCFQYTLYWIPPLVIALRPSNCFFLEALGSTLTTHAVGSVLWLYTHQTTPLFWNILFYRVWAERLLLSVLLTTVYSLALMVKQSSPLINSREKLCHTGY